jgi:hypothetical protein
MALTTQRIHPLLLQVNSDTTVTWERITDLLRAIAWDPTARGGADAMVPALVNEIHESAWPFVSDYRIDCALASDHRTTSHQKMNWTELLRLRWLMKQRQRATKMIERIH